MNLKINDWKKNINIFLIVLIIFSGGSYFLIKPQQNQKNNFSYQKTKQESTSLTKMNLFNQNFWTKSLNDALYFEHINENIFLEINKNKFEELLKDFIIQIIYEKFSKLFSNFQDINNLHGKIYYSLDNEKNANVFVKWYFKNQEQFLNYFDYFFISLKKN